MSMKSSLTSTTKYWPLIIMLAIIGSFVFVAPFVSIIALSALMAFLFYPLYAKIVRKITQPALAAGITLILSLLLVITPIVVVSFITIVQLITLTGEFANIDITTLPDTVKVVIASVNDILAPFSGQETVISGESIVEFLRNTLPNILKGVVGILIGIAGSVPLAAILTIMYIILFSEFLIYGKRLLALFISISPFEKEVSQLYLNRIGTMATAMIKGQFVISVVISAMSAFLLIFLGLGDYFFLLFILFTLMNLVPLGCGVVMIPISIIAMVTGNFWPGLFVLLAYTLICNLDNVIRPRVIPKSVHLSAGLTMIAAFAGIYYYGLLGVVYGPIVMIILVTTITMYASYRDKKTPQSLQQ